MVLPHLLDALAHIAEQAANEVLDTGARLPTTQRRAWRVKCWAARHRLPPRAPPVERFARLPAPDDPRWWLCPELPGRPGPGLLVLDHVSVKALGPMLVIEGPGTQLYSQQALQGYGYMVACAYRKRHPDATLVP